MSLSGDTDKVNGVTVVWLLQHVEGLAKAQISKNVHGQPAAPVGHVFGGTPALVFRNESPVIANCFAESPDVGQDVPLNLLDGAVREGMGEDSSLSGVEVFVASIVGVGRRVNKGVVELGLLDIGSVSVDLVQRRVGVDGQRVGPEPHKLAILFVHSPKLEMPVTPPRVVQHVGIGELGQEWPWVFG